MENLSKLQKCYTMENRYKTVFIYDIESDDKLFDSIVRILSKEEHKVMNMNEAIDFIFEVQNKYSELL